jgi:hypothetical protein
MGSGLIDGEFRELNVLLTRALLSAGVRMGVLLERMVYFTSVSIAAVYEAQQVGRRCRPVNGVALRIVAPPFPQQRERLVVLDAFGDRRQTHRCGEMQDGAHDLLIVGVRGEGLHELLVDL